MTSDRTQPITVYSSFREHACAATRQGETKLALESLSKTDATNNEHCGFHLQTAQLNRKAPREQPQGNKQERKTQRLKNQHRSACFNSGFRVLAPASCSWDAGSLPPRGGSGLCSPGPVLVTLGIWRMNQQTGTLPVCPSASVSLLFHSFSLTLSSSLPSVSLVLKNNLFNFKEYSS